jgi:diguanylate cyclase (GGDEF)-like protein
MPLVTQRKYYGLIVVEYRENHQYARQDLNILARIAALSANAMEITQLHEYTRSQLLIDEDTRTSSRALLLRRLREEQARLREFGGSAVFFLAGLDARDELIEKHGRHEVEHMMFQIAEALRPFLKDFDVIGRFDSSRLGLLLLHSSAEDAYLRGEKMRKAVASTLMSHEGQSYAVTVSIAGCTLSQTSDIDHILKLASQALDRAVSDGGNCVKVV